MKETVLQTKEKLNPRKIFWQCGACSNAMFHLLNHEFDNVKLPEEKASDMLAGGIAQKGYQCGMLWGSALAVGAESFKRYSDMNEAVSAAIVSSRCLIESFEKRSGTVNCRDITKVDWENKLAMAFYMVKVILRGFVFSPCFNMIVKWTPEAVQAANEGLTSERIQNSHCLSCASEVVKRMGGSDEEAVMVAGFAGGIGLSGNACGALSAAIWYTMLKQQNISSAKSPSMFNNPDVKKILRTFYIQTDSVMLCSQICGREFDNLNEHTEYIENGGCSSIIKALSEPKN